MPEAVSKTKDIETAQIAFAGGAWVIRLCDFPPRKCEMVHVTSKRRVAATQPHPWPDCVGLRWDYMGSIQGALRAAKCIKDCNPFYSADTGSTGRTSSASTSLHR